MSWNPAPNSYVYSLAASGGYVYAGGLFTTIGGRTRNRLAAIDGLSGYVAGWDPDLDNSVAALSISAPVVYVGGSFSTAGGRMNRSLAAFGDVVTVGVREGDRTYVDRIELRPAFPNPVRNRGTIPFLLPRDAAVTLRMYDLAGRCTRTLLDHAWLPAGRHELPFTPDGLKDGVYFYRLEVGGSSASGRVVVLRR